MEQTSIASSVVERSQRTQRGSASSLLIKVLATIVSLALILPLVFLILEAVQDGWGTLHPLLFRQLTLQLIWNSVSLTVVVTALSAVIGTLAAWFVERTDLPGRRIWAVLVVVPLGIPDFVVSFGWRAIFPGIGGFWGATIVMTLAVYPLVYLPVAASLRGADPAHEEVARSLGQGRLKTFWRVSIGQARTAILGGSVLVALVLLAEYGAFEILGYRTLTTVTFTEFTVGFDQPTAAAFSLLLVGLSILVLAGESLGRGKGRIARVGSGARRLPRPYRLARSRGSVLVGFGLLVLLALGVPVGGICYLLVLGGRSTIPPASIAAAAGHTFAYSATAGIVATVAALPIAILSLRHPGRLSNLMERSNYLVLAMSGLVIALAFTYFSERYAAGFLYQSTLLLILTYSVMFFPMALVAVRASVARAPQTLEEVGRSLGASRLEVFRRVTLPLLGPGLAAAFCLVFLEAATELTATLILIPTGAQTLATQFWAFQSNFSYAQAAPYAGLMILIAAVPSYVLGRWFDRLPTQTAVRT